LTFDQSLDALHFGTEGVTNISNKIMISINQNIKDTYQIINKKHSPQKAINHLRLPETTINIRNT
jgi:hypothetical protein